MRGGETTSLRIATIEEGETDETRRDEGRERRVEKERWGLARELRTGTDNDIDRSRPNQALLFAIRLDSRQFRVKRNYLNSSSRSSTLFSSFINIVFRKGKSLAGVL